MSFANIIFNWYSIKIHGFINKYYELLLIFKLKRRTVFIKGIGKDEKSDFLFIIHWSNQIAYCYEVSVTPRQEAVNVLRSIYDLFVYHFTKVHAPSKCKGEKGCS